MTSGGGTKPTANPADRGKGIYAPPTKRSVTIAGHETSVTIEPIFWHALRVAAAEENLPLNALIARIDVERIAVFDPPNLASALRIWLYARQIENDTQQR